MVETESNVVLLPVKKRVSKSAADKRYDALVEEIYQAAKALDIARSDRNGASMLCHELQQELNALCVAVDDRYGLEAEYSDPQRVAMYRQIWCLSQNLCDANKRHERLFLADERARRRCDKAWSRMATLVIDMAERTKTVAA